MSLPNTVSSNTVAGIGTTGIPIQWGVGQLVNGVASIAVTYYLSAGAKNITNSSWANSVVMLSRADKNASTAIGVLSAATADRTSGSPPVYGPGGGVITPGIPGGIIVKSLDSTGSIVTGDQSYFEYVIVG